MKKVIGLLAVLSMFLIILVVVKPVLAADEPHRFPCIFWDDNSGPLNVSIAYKDNNGSWQVNADIVTDADPSQFINQHNRLVYMTDGEYGFALIESLSHDLELWQEGTIGWSADGTFTLTDDDTSQNWDNVDVRSLQNGLHGMAVAGLDMYQCDIFPDGAGNWIVLYIQTLSVDAEEYTVTGDKNLSDWLVIYMESGVNLAITHDFTFKINSITFTPSKEQRQIVVDDNQNIWIFGTVTGTDLMVDILPDPVTTIYTTFSGNMQETLIDLTGPDAILLDYKASVRYTDNTLHVVSLEVVDITAAPVVFELNYYRRDQNGWSNVMTVDTWSLTIPHVIEQIERDSVQITVDNSGNILLFNIEWDAINSRGDLKVWELPLVDYDEYTTGGNWDESTIDGGIDDVLGCSSLNIHP